MKAFIKYLLHYNNSLNPPNDRYQVYFSKPISVRILTFRCGINSNFSVVELENRADAVLSAIKPDNMPDYDFENWKHNVCSSFTNIHGIYEDSFTNIIDLMHFYAGY